MTVRERRNPVPVAISFALHAAAFFLLLGVPGVHLPHASDSEYKQKISGHEPKLVWYKFPRELPAVSPVGAKPEKAAPKAETLAKQQIVSSPKNAPRREQTVWTPAPVLIPAQPLEAPNLIAVKLPDPPVKAFEAPPEAPKPNLKAVEVPEAPALAAKAEPNVAQLSVALPPKRFIPPRLENPAPPRPQIAADAPALAAVTGAPVSGLSAKLPPRPFTAPPLAHGTGSARSVSVETRSDLDLAIVGLKPVETATLLPSLPSPGQFSAGPRVNPNGASPGAAAGLTVPSLFVGGARAAPGPGALAQAIAPPSITADTKAAMRVALRNEPAAPEAAESRTPSGTSAALPRAAKVSSAPDPRFDGRDIYMMAIQLPNITSNSGSWLMWYSDRALREPGHGAVSPPVARRKVDPKYVASAVSERVEGRVQLACVIDREGKVSLIELVRGVDARLNESAKEALAKWEFIPATRNGLPTEVDVLVEIPFRLAPPPPRR